MNLNPWGIAGAVVLGAGLYYMTAETKIEKLKRKGVEEAHKATRDHFIILIKNDPETTLDTAILDFENAKTNNLEKFVKSKHRTVESYYTAYSKLFEEAKNELDI